MSNSSIQNRIANPEFIKGYSNPYKPAFGGYFLFLKFGLGVWMANSPNESFHNRDPSKTLHNREGTSNVFFGKCSFSSRQAPKPNRITRKQNNHLTKNQIIWGSLTGFSWPILARWGWLGFPCQTGWDRGDGFFLATHIFRWGWLRSPCQIEIINWFCQSWPTHAPKSWRVFPGQILSCGSDGGFPCQIYVMKRDGVFENPITIPRPKNGWLVRKLIFQSTPSKPGPPLNATGFSKTQSQKRPYDSNQSDFGKLPRAQGLIGLVFFLGIATGFSKTQSHLEPGKPWSTLTGFSFNCTRILKVICRSS